MEEDLPWEMEDPSCENLSRLVTSPVLLSHLQTLTLDGGEKNVSFQWFGPHFLTFLKYAKEYLHFRPKNEVYLDWCDRFYGRNLLRNLLKRLDYSASDCILYGEIFSYFDNEHYKNILENFLETILTVMPKLKKFFTVQGRMSTNFFVDINDWEIFINFLFESIQELLSCHNDSTVLVSNQVKFLQKGLNFLLTFLLYPFPSGEEEQKSIFTEIGAVFNEAGFFLHSFFFTTDHVTSTKMDLAIFVLLERIEIVLVKIKDYSIAVSSEVGIRSPRIAESPSEVGVGSPQVAESPSEVGIAASKKMKVAEIPRSSSQDESIRMVEEIIVGLEDTTTQIVGKLIGEPSRGQIISIVGMGGLGKTTLAKKLYNHSSVRHYFDKLSWCAVSQTYNKRKLLKDLLSSSSNLKKDDISKMEDEELAEHLYKNLKGRRYLIVMDDLWDKEAWEDLERLFPDDTNGSRLLFTSRQKNVASEISQVIIEPRPLSPGESWNLLEQKVFKKEHCPRELQDIGKQIAANCKGLPLQVVLIAGVLSNMERKESLWQQVAKTYYIFQKANDYIPSLKLSYIHLPDPLKPCFLYLSTFQEDEEIRVQKLLLLWIIEGLIEKKEHKSLEDVAEEYLMELIDRSLLQVVRRRSDNNGVKACNLHDLVLDMCRKMVEEDENFLFQHQFLVSKHRHLHRLYMRQFHHDWMSKNISEAFSIVYNLEKIRILDSSNDTRGVRQGIKLMPDLMYLEFLRLEPSIGKLHNLEYLCLPFVREVPTYRPNMPKLRHLRVGERVHMKGDGAIFTKNSGSFQINCLQTLCFVGIFDSEDGEILRYSPNLRTLKCNILDLKDDYFPDLSFHSQLQSLTIHGYGDYSVCKFPMNIKKLTLLGFHLPWEKMSSIGTLPNLEVLKIEQRDQKLERSGYCPLSEKIWDTKDDEFQKLKFLKLVACQLEQWNSSRYHFPLLERLVLFLCTNLEEIPCEFGNILTLQEIKVLYCGEKVGTSALEIGKEQRDCGNTEFNVTIRRL